MEQFKDIVKAKRKELELKQRELADELGISYMTVSHWELGAIPTFFLTDALADFFGCSVDELCGRTGYTYNPPKKMREFKDILYDKLFEKNIDYNVFAEMIGVGYNAVWGWTSGRTYPNLKMLCDIADALGCSIDELMGRKLNKE